MSIEMQPIVIRDIGTKATYEMIATVLSSASGPLVPVRK
jgi:hypothetical protein